MVRSMFDVLRDRVKAWWDSLDIEDENGPRGLTHFRPMDAAGLPRPIQQVLAIGALAAILVAGGVALVSLSALLVSVFAIYLLVTEVLGLDFEIDPRIWQAL